MHDRLAASFRRLGLGRECGNNQQSEYNLFHCFLISSPSASLDQIGIASPIRIDNALAVFDEHLLSPLQLG
jgi:hypothetical protein